MTVGELKAILADLPDYYEVLTDGCYTVGPVIVDVRTEPELEYAVLTSE